MFGLFRKTVDGALRRLNQALVDLEVVIEQREGENSVRQERIGELAGEIAMADIEIGRARRVKARLEELLS